MGHPKNQKTVNKIFKAAFIFVVVASPIRLCSASTKDPLVSSYAAIKFEGMETARRIASRQAVEHSIFKNQNNDISLTEDQIELFKKMRSDIQALRERHRLYAVIRFISQLLDKAYPNEDSIKNGEAMIRAIDDFLESKNFDEEKMDKVAEILHRVEDFRANMKCAALDKDGKRISIKCTIAPEGGKDLFNEDYMHLYQDFQESFLKLKDFIKNQTPTAPQ